MPIDKDSISLTIEESVVMEIILKFEEALKEQFTFRDGYCDKIFRLKIEIFYCYFKVNEGRY